MSARESKQTIRNQMRAALTAIPRSSREEFSRQAVRRLCHQAVWRDAGAVLLFAPMADEIDIWPLAQEALASGKILALPGYQPTTGAYAPRRVGNLVEDLAVGPYGIREPNPSCPELPLKQLDFILVPGLAFDPCGRRLGRGKGFFDRLLAAVRGTTCGVAFDVQILAEIPVEPHDVHLNCILTPTRWIEL
jgi:5-formyltetrahydrofolate cyclo-ligase